MIRRILWTELIIGLAIVTSTTHLLGNLTQTIRCVSVLLALFYLPGYRRSFVFFRTDELTTTERGMMSVAISLAVIVYLGFYLHYAGLVVTDFLAVSGSTLLILLAGSLLLALPRAGNDEE